jgi:hypothetical protein
MPRDRPATPSRGGVRGETHSRATCSSHDKERGASRRELGGRTSAVRRRRHRLHGRLPTAPSNVPASQPTSARALATRSRGLARTVPAAPAWFLDGSRLLAARHRTPKRRRTNHCVRPTFLSRDRGRNGHGGCSPQSAATMDARVTTAALRSSARHGREQPMLLVHCFLATPRIVGWLAARLGRLGYFLTRGSQLLDRDDPDVAEEVRRFLSAEEIEVVLGADVLRVEGRSGEAVRVRARTEGNERTIAGTDILNATGRTPSSAGNRIRNCRRRARWAGLREGK